MALEIKAFGEIKNGGFWPRNPEVYQQQIRDAGNVSECVLTITGANKRTHDQNNYAHAVFHQIAVRMQQDGWDVSGYELYKKAEQMYCTEIRHNGDKKIEITKSLKEQPTDKFAEVIDKVRLNAMNRYPDIYIKLPHEWYGLTIEAYDLWKMGKITFAEAKKQSKSKLPQPEEQ